MSKSTLTYEHDFIVNLLAGNQSEATKLIDKVDPNSILKGVKYHKIASAIGRQSPLLPDGEIKTKLNEAYHSNKIYQLQLTNELCQIQKWFEGVDFLPLKGPVLSQFLHNDPAERTSSDIDILIDLKDLDNCTKALQVHGYDLITIFKTEKQKEAIIKYHHHFEFYNPNKEILIELHWGLTGMKGINLGLNDLVPVTSTISINNNQFRILDIEYQFEYLSIHGTFHSFNRLLWLCDIKTFYESFSDEQINSVISHSKRNNSYKFILVSLSLLNRIFSIPLNSSIQFDIDENQSVQQLTNLSMREIYLNSIGKDRSNWEVLLQNHKTQFFASGLSGLLKSLFARSVRPKNWEFYAFPDRVFFLNHILSRFIWIVGKISGKL